MHAYKGTFTGIGQRHSFGHFEISLTVAGRPGICKTTATIL